MAKGFTDQERVKGFALFRGGESTNQVAAQLFNKNYARAKKLRDEYDAANDIEPIDVRAAIEEPEQPIWDLTVQVSTERMDGIIASFTAQEKATAIAAVLSQRYAAEG